MRWIISISVLLLMSSPGDAGRTFFYKTYREKTGEVLTRSARYIENLSPDRIKVTIKWESESNGTSGTQEYVLDADYATQRWKVSHPGEDTDYVGERKGNMLVIKGRLNGKPMDKTIEIDEKQFYNNPSVGLEGFVRSGQEKLEFRTIRPDNLSEYKMKAAHKGVETITINGKKVEAIRVKWGLTGLRSKFYSRTFWFRKSDSVFVKSNVSGGESSELVSEP